MFVHDLPDKGVGLRHRPGRPEVASNDPPEFPARIAVTCVHTGMNDSYLTVGAVAARIGVHVDTVRRMEAGGHLTPVRLPSGHRRYRRADVDLLLAAGDGVRSPRAGIGPDPVNAPELATPPFNGTSGPPSG